jgi:hypothetical protein
VAAACAWSVALVGLEGRIVEVEADIGAGLPRTVLVGLPDSALYQARAAVDTAAAAGNPGADRSRWSTTWPAGCARHTNPMAGRLRLRPMP